MAERWTRLGSALPHPRTLVRQTLRPTLVTVTWQRCPHSRWVVIGAVWCRRGQAAEL
jgi:hypothetical protein